MNQFAWAVATALLGGASGWSQARRLEADVEQSDVYYKSRIRGTRLLNQVRASLNRVPRLWANAGNVAIYRHDLDRAMHEIDGELGGNEPSAPIPRTSRSMLRLVFYSVQQHGNGSISDMNSTRFCDNFLAYIPR